MSYPMWKASATQNAVTVESLHVTKTDALNAVWGQLGQNEDAVTFSAEPVTVTIEEE